MVPVPQYCNVYEKIYNQKYFESGKRGSSHYSHNILFHTYLTLVALSFASHVKILLFLISYLHSKSFDANIIKDDFNTISLTLKLYLDLHPQSSVLCFISYSKNFHASLLLFPKGTGSRKAIIFENKWNCHIPNMAKVVTVFILPRTVCCSISNSIIFTMGIWVTFR